jgi:hypothetical protein
MTHICLRHILPVVIGVLQKLTLARLTVNCYILAWDSTGCTCVCEGLLWHICQTAKRSTLKPAGELLSCTHCLFNLGVEYISIDQVFVMPLRSEGTNGFISCTDLLTK